jgi:hypothetical protein
MYSCTPRMHACIECTNERDPPARGLAPRALLVAVGGSSNELEVLHSLHAVSEAARHVL